VSGVPGSAAGAGAGDKNKAQKCKRCLATVKDIARGEQCPGCSALYCWRCEKKFFQSCPNGPSCVHPLRRCQDCAFGDTMLNVWDNAVNIIPNADDFKTKGVDIVDSLMKHSVVTIDASPIRRCGKKGCPTSELKECMRCLNHPDRTNLLKCSGCGKVRCRSCHEASTGSCYSSIVRLIETFSKMPREIPLDPIETTKLAEEILPSLQDGMVMCTTCNERYKCFACIGFKKIRGMMFHRFTTGGEVPDFECDSCYYAAKPCTNPDCPNEVGVPTKRCGDCRRARYCSKECQKAAYPDHVRTCRNIQEKRATRASNKN